MPNIITKLMSENDCYKAGRTITPRGITIHSTAEPGMRAGWVLLNQKFSGREMLGCAIMFAAIVLAQLPDLIAAAKKKKGKAA